MNNSFLALDVETANADYSSICQIGIVQIEDGLITERWSTLINPKAYFDPFNVSIHGIREEDIKNAPTFNQIYNELSKRISDQITVHHMPFDKTAISRACIENKLEIINARWLDSAKIVRRTWDHFAHRGYGLANVANFLNLNFEHHNALEDAVTAAKVVLHACDKNQISIEEWFYRIYQPINVIDTGPVKIHFEGNPEGSFYGETIVFTGALSLPRFEAAKIAANLGCHVDNSVTKNTTILVVGTQDFFRLAGYEKSSKHRKTEDLIQKGFPIKILSERDFIEICKSENCNQRGTINI